MEALSNNRLDNSWRSQFSGKEPVFGSRDLVKASTRNIEMENSVILTGKARNALMLGAEAMNWDFGRTNTLSVYFETYGVVDGWLAPTLGFLENGTTLRLRQEGTSRKIGKNKKEFVSEIYPAQVSLKRVDPSFQRYANEISDRVSPDAGFFKPRTREEIEDTFLYDGLSELHYGDLPSGQIGIIIENLVREGKLEGVYCLEDLVLRPIVATDVLRLEANVYIDPENARPKDFLRTWPLSEPTRKMEKREDYIKLGFCADRMKVKKTDEALPISAVVGASRKDLANPAKFEDLAYVPIGEWEVKGCGENTEDRKLIEAYIKFGLGMDAYVRKASGFTVVPSWSKGVTAIGALEECRPNGRLFDKYKSLQSIAP